MWIFISRLVVVAIVVGVTVSSACYGQDSVSPLDADGHIVDFSRDIVPILKMRCLECHGADDTKGDFRVDQRDGLMSYVEPGDLESSTVYVDYLTSDDPDTLMPPPSKGGPLSAAELALIRLWIQEGASWPDGVQVSSEVEKAPPPPPPTSLVGRVWGFIGFLHPPIVHFPIALLTLGAGFVVLGWKWPKWGTQVPLACLLIGAASAIVATLMGWSFATAEGYPSWTNFDMDDEFFWHRWGGVIVAIFSSAMAIVALISIKNNSDQLTKVWKVGLLVSAAMVGAVGHQGGELVYGADFFPKAFRTLLGTPEEGAAEDQPAAESLPEAVVDPPAEAAARSDVARSALIVMTNTDQRKHEERN